LYISRVGFTLLELLVVLFLISLSLTLVGPRVAKFKVLPAQDFPAHFRLLLDKAREKALITGRGQVVYFSSSQRHVYLANLSLSKISYSLKIPKDIEIKARDLTPTPKGAAILFFPSGFSSGGEVEIVNHKEHIIIIFKLARFQIYISEEKKKF